MSKKKKKNLILRMNSWLQDAIRDLIKGEKVDSDDDDTGEEYSLFQYCFRQRSVQPNWQKLIFC